MNIEKEELLFETHQKFMETGFNSPESLDILDEIAAPDVMGFGTAVDERIFSVADLKDLIVRQREQSQGIQIRWNAIPILRQIVKDDNAAVFVDDIAIEITVNNETIKMSLRYSTVMEYRADKWVMIHFHGSKPENVTTDEDTYGIKKWINRNAELEKLVNKRTAELEKSLADLKSTQQQLVQQEKLASLGALTAGIAHEIKNPLNFVNNFSELSNELIKEFKESKSEEERNEILSDLELNLEKINQHGKRADSIVKNMLQHSRSGSGEKQLTDINQMCEEFLNLAYHGKRANTPEFNCEMIKQLDPNLPRVNCVAQDISRVILNLINNAFDELANLSPTLSKGEGGTADHAQTKLPTLTLSSAVSLSPSGRVGEGLITITVRDNGRGIPNDMKEKIFEPFFTTKAAGQGTGLGLSLSYDIIKAHGGELTVESRVGEGSTFIIHLPF